MRLYAPDAFDTIFPRTQTESGKPRGLSAPLSPDALNTPPDYLAGHLPQGKYLRVAERVINFPAMTLGAGEAAFFLAKRYVAAEDQEVNLSQIRFVLGPADPTAFGYANNADALAYGDSNGNGAGILVGVNCSAPQLRQWFEARARLPQMLAAPADIVTFDSENLLAYQSFAPGKSEDALHLPRQTTIPLGLHVQRVPAGATLDVVIVLGQSTAAPANNRKRIGENIAGAVYMNVLVEIATQMLERGRKMAT